MYHPQQMTNPFDFPLDDFGFNLFSSEMHSPHALLDPETMRALMDPRVQAAPTIMERPMKKLKTEIRSSTCSPETNVAPRTVICSQSSSPQLISFGRLDLSPVESQQHYGSHEIRDCQKEMKRDGAMSRSTLHTQEHVIAERKRRQKLSQNFIALSAIIPGLKKVNLLQQTSLPFLEKFPIAKNIYLCHNIRVAKTNAYRQWLYVWDRNVDTPMVGYLIITLWN